MCLSDVWLYILMPRYGVFRQDEDELPRVYKTGAGQEDGEAGYCLQDMDLEIQRVARELYKAFNGLNEGFKEVRIADLDNRFILKRCQTNTYL